MISTELRTHGNGTRTPPAPSAGWLPRAVALALLLPMLAYAAAEPRVETVRVNGITLTLAFSPATVALDRDMLLSVTVAHPEGVTVEIPPLHDRLEGFALESSYDREPAPAAGGLVSRERIVRLTPLVAPEYRLAPMAVAFREADGDERYFATPPVVLPLTALMDSPLGDAPRGTLVPVPVRPSLKTLSRYAGLAALAVLALALAGFLLGRLRRQIRVLRMSPRELDLLMAKHLPEAGRFKDFYVELTLIVRRYIERQHRVRAPELTTGEFLQAIAGNPRFAPSVVDRLKSFLEAADLVKFAAWLPDRSIVTDSVSTAKEYIASDETGEKGEHDA